MSIRISIIIGIILFVAITTTVYPVGNDALAFKNNEPSVSNTILVSIPIIDTINIQPKYNNQFTNIAIVNHTQYHYIITFINNNDPDPKQTLSDITTRFLNEEMTTSTLFNTQVTRENGISNESLQSLQKYLTLFHINEVYKQYLQSTVREQLTIIDAHFIESNI